MVDLRSSSPSGSGRRRVRSAVRGRTTARAPALAPTVGAGAATLHAALTRAPRRSPQSLAGRRFLIVTAPFGPFGMALAKVLEARGAEVRRMIFNAGDALNWRRTGGLVFKDDAQAWDAGLAAFTRDFTDIVLFGESRPHNRAVLSQQDQLVPKVWVLENGYFRPDWITVELNGVNGSSGLPRRRDAYARPAPEPSPARPVGKILPHHVANISLYHVAQGVCAPLFPKDAPHYTVTPLQQCLGHIRRYFSLAFQPRGDADADRIAARGPFFIACLQREGDSQLLRYSRYGDNTAFLTAVIDDFARNAPPACRLVVKNHPLDPGLIDLSAATRRIAQQFGVGDRVDFIDGGNLARLCRASRGMIVNNSSAALSALGFHTPVKVLGDAFFDFDGLTDQQPLNGFWSSPQAPDAALFLRFRAHVIAQSQVNGNFHEPAAIPDTAQGVADVFERPPQSPPRPRAHTVAL